MFYQHWQQRRRHKAEHYYQVILMLGSPRLSGIVPLHILATPIDWLARLQCLVSTLSYCSRRNIYRVYNKTLVGKKKAVTATTAG
jgi:hypothetical protein